MFMPAPPNLPGYAPNWGAFPLLLPLSEITCFKRVFSVKFQTYATLMSSSEASSSFGAFTDEAPSRFFPPIGTCIKGFYFFYKTSTDNFGLKRHLDQPPSHLGLQTLNQTSLILLQNHQSPRLLQISSSVLLPEKKTCSITK